MSGGAANSGVGRVRAGADPWAKLRLVDEEPAPVGEGWKTIRELAQEWGRPYVSVGCYLDRMCRDGLVERVSVVRKVGHCRRRVWVYRPVEGKAKGRGRR